MQYLSVWGSQDNTLSSQEHYNDWKNLNSKPEKNSPPSKGFSKELADSLNQSVTRQTQYKIEMKAKKTEMWNQLSENDRHLQFLAAKTWGIQNSYYKDVTDAQNYFKAKGLRK